MKLNFFKKFIIITSVLLINISLLPPQGLAAESDDIIIIAEKNGDFTKFIEALKYTGLDKKLREEGPFTLFAPTDEAFIAFDKKHPGLIAGWMKTDEGKKKLEDFLLYHVVPAELTAEKIKEMKSDKAANGKTLTITTSDEGIKINGSKITKADIKGSNGVIHTINHVLTVPSEDTAPEAAPTEKK
ncbi:MAG: fasciclin domain-containing protein [Alphaproteobacteria bacterium]|nr:fasciclin domain-containing protein [Alphaproteobacteria bacterium]